MNRQSPWKKGHPAGEGAYFVHVPSPVRHDKSELFFVAIWQNGAWTGLPQEWAQSIDYWMHIPPVPQLTNGTHERN